MKKTAEWYEIDNLIPDGTWHNHADEWWLESPDSIFTLRVSKLGEKVDWWMYRKSSLWLSGDFFTSYESQLGDDAQLFDMVINDYESKAWGLDDLVMSDPYRYSKKSVRKRANESGRRATKNGTTMKPNLFQQYELDALLGEYADDFDIDGIIREVTIIDRDGDRIWKDLEDDDLYRIIEEHDMSNSDYIRGACRSRKAARKTALLDDDVYRQSMQIVDDVEGELDYENAYYSHDTLLSMYDIMRDAIDAFATSKFLGSDESSLSRQWQEAVDRTKDFLDATGSIFTAREVVHAYADIIFAKHDRPYFRDVYGSRKGQLTCRCTRDC